MSMQGACCVKLRGRTPALCKVAGGSMFALRQHLRTIHKEVETQLAQRDKEIKQENQRTPEERKEVGINTPENQPTILKEFDQFTKVDPTCPIQIKYVENLVEYLECI